MASGSASAATRYVWQESPSPAPPYDTWANAATNIQDAVDAADPGDTVLVTNGVYATGGRAVYGTMTNRVAVDKPLTLISVNGPEVTIIQGYQLPGTTNGDGAIRCVYLTNGASLSGFTLTNGATRKGGDLLREWSGGGVWCESSAAIITNCVLMGNSSAWRGGGAYQGTLNNCTLTENSAIHGGGVYGGTLKNCMLSGNSVYQRGGGAHSSTLINCALTGNSASLYGGGAYYSTLDNCTLTENSCYWGGGVFDSTLKNCIVYYNTRPGATSPLSANYDLRSTLCYCCTTPLALGPGNISTPPGLSSPYRIGADSPCRGAGSAAYTTGSDIDGEPWANPPSIGCDEFYAGTASGDLSVGIVANYTNVTEGYPIELEARIEGQAEGHLWDFGDGTVVSNQLHTSHAWPAPGSYDVLLTAYNQTHPSGVSATATVSVVTQPVHYVAANGTNPVVPYTSWATAATNIQDAVDVAERVPGTLVLVTNGIYNRVVVDKPLILRSVNGPKPTIIDGLATVGCLYLTNDACVAGFTLTNGNVGAGYGAGVLCESSTAIVRDCVISAGQANLFHASRGAGAYSGTLLNCLLIGNNADGWGGGAHSSVLINCVLVDNYANASGGGAYQSMLINCIAYYNSTDFGVGNYDGAEYSVSYSCTTPLPFNSLGNIANTPLFVDYAGGNLRLQSNSPCINAGNNAYVTSPTDLDGNPRIVNGTVDMGAYEYQGDGSVISYAWLQHYGLPTDGSADTLDADLDGHNAWQEWKAWTDPTNALSVLKLLPPQPQPNGTLVLWQSVLGQSYSVERATNASGPFSMLQGNIPGQADTTSFNDTNAAYLSPLFYRVGVSE